jgi:hypothetical protein
MDERQRSGLMAGLILVVLGLGLLAINLVQGLGNAAILFLVGGVFVAFYLYRRNYGLLIPGCILLGLGLGAIGQVALAAGDYGSWTLDNLSSLGLGAGFLAIYLIDRIYRGATHWWPLIPGGVLVIAGLAQSNGDLRRVLSLGWPLILVLVGLVLLAGTLGLTGKRRE